MKKTYLLGKFNNYLIICIVWPFWPIYILGGGGRPPGVPHKPEVKGVWRASGNIYHVIRETYHIIPLSPHHQPHTSQNTIMNSNWLASKDISLKISNENKIVNWNENNSLTHYILLMLIQFTRFRKWSYSQSSELPKV